MITPMERSFVMNSGTRYLPRNESSHDDDEGLLDAELRIENKQFAPLRTILIFSSHLLLSTVISLIGVGFSINQEVKTCQSYFIMLYLRAAYWGITFIFKCCVKNHHESLRLKGYLQFHHVLSPYKGIAFYVVSFWNTIILAIATLMQHYYGSNLEDYCIRSIFSPIVYITSFCVLELFVLYFFHGSYIGKVYRFNKLSPSPDALKRNTAVGGSLGLTQRGAQTRELLEKQADLIDYYIDSNLQLTKKLMLLNAQVKFTNMPQNN